MASASASKLAYFNGQQTFFTKILEGKLLVIFRPAINGHKHSNIYDSWLELDFYSEF
jgi:hypothetical protein